MRIAILALQGAFAEHQQMLQRLGVATCLIRNLNDWLAYIQEVMPYPITHEASHNDGKTIEGGLIIPGGESTAMMKIMRDEGLFEPLRQAIADGLPVFGTCAGLILLDSEHLGVMDIHAKRNAYGRQLGSFACNSEINGVGNFPMVFIRAPYIEKTGESVEVLSVVDGKVVAARQGNMLATAFHPELTEDTRLHEFFLKVIHNCVYGCSIN